MALPGARSTTTAYGLNRADWSYIPGGVVSGTNLVRPDLPELKDFPFPWQQAEYVLGGMPNGDRRCLGVGPRRST